ncbi:aminopeptidase N [Desulfospira joergensenii]|uniref:aminopeptidase N n=1 Tax=Desulfospira joergensenii TaxID=53329 RepID=UPI0003B5DDD2|nr:aminopeptidase N [Desulfospira joergensenii]
METPKRIYLKDYRPPEFFVDTVDLTFELDVDRTRVSASMKVRKNLEIADEATSLVFDKGDLEIESVIADGMVLLPHEYEIGEESFKLARTPNEFTLEIISILHPKANTRLEGLYCSGDFICTQCEAQGFRRILPFPDRPDVMAIYSCTIIADKDLYPVLLSNGNLVKSGDLDNNRHYVRWEDPFKKPCYLFALVAGDFACLSDTFITCSGRKIDLKIYSEQENIDKCDHAMESLKQVMKWDEDRFGLEYDLDLFQIVAINDFNAGAMENKGLNIFNSKYVLASPQTATDDDYMNIQGVIGHEYFHNWTGNRVTLKNWFQLSLKEGLTVFRDQEFSSDLNSRGVKRISGVKNLRAFQFPEDAGPMTHPVRPESYIKMDNFYTMTVYEKGAELIRMIHQILGEELFQIGMKLYFERFDGMAVTIEDFLKAMEDGSGKDLDQFRLWYSQSGTPRISLNRSYDADKKILFLDFEQTTLPDRNQKIKNPLHIPIRFGLLDKTGKDITPEGRSLLELKTQKTSFQFKGIGPDALPSIFRQFSAPVRIESDFTEADLAFFMAHDSDEFNRWDAAQTLFIKEIQRLVSGIQNKKSPTVSPELISAFESALMDTGADRAFLAKALSLPTEMEIKDHYDLIDVSAIHRARSFLKQTLARKLKDRFMDILEICSQADPASVSQRAAADRSLKNLALSFLGSLKEKETSDLVLNRFETAMNMTDEFAAFRILSRISPEYREKGVKQFYAKWGDDKLVLDKWFAVQAASDLPDTLEQVEDLLNHPDFSLTNPNKVRSLVYVFAIQNPLNFHRPDGRGYEFIAEQILALDRINPQIAARLSSCFNHWKRYDNIQKPLMEKELRRILKLETLSKNVYEIVSRALE